ncbi:hypothetical protein I5G20_13710 [Pseudomonas aeruginosa]|nr:hypothetical protein [Pseudomonas aeruginosa]
MNLNKLLDSLEGYGVVEVKEKVAKAKLKHAAIDDKQISKEPEEAAKLIDELPNDVKATNNGLDVKEAHKPNIHWKSDRGLVTEVDSFGKTYIVSNEGFSDSIKKFFGVANRGKQKKLFNSYTSVSHLARDIIDHFTLDWLKKQTFVKGDISGKGISDRLIINGKVDILDAIQANAKFVEQDAKMKETLNQWFGMTRPILDYLNKNASNLSDEVYAEANAMLAKLKKPAFPKLPWPAEGYSGKAIFRNDNVVIPSYNGEGPDKLPALDEVTATKALDQILKLLDGLTKVRLDLDEVKEQVSRYMWSDDLTNPKGKVSYDKWNTLVLSVVSYPVGSSPDERMKWWRAEGCFSQAIYACAKWIDNSIKGKISVESAEVIDSSNLDTRQNPSNLPDLPEDVPSINHEQNFVSDSDPATNIGGEYDQVVSMRTTLEEFIGLIKEAGDKGITRQSAAFMDVALESIDRYLGRKDISNEKYDASPRSAMTFIQPSLEDLGERLEALGKKLLALIIKFIDEAKAFGQRMLSGINSTLTETDELIDKAKKLANGIRVSNERAAPDFNMTLQINSPKLLYLCGEFILDDMSCERKVSTFLARDWPTTALSNIDRAVKMLKNYDLETDNLDKFDESFNAIGNGHMFDKVNGTELPGNVKLTFVKDKFGPRLVESDQEAAPESISIEIRDLAIVRKTLDENKVQIRDLGELFKAEARVLERLRLVASEIEGLDGRRSKTVWKGAREDADAILRIAAEFARDIKPEYSTHISHLLRIAKQRNAVCNMELERYGQ